MFNLSGIFLSKSHFSFSEKTGPTLPWKANSILKWFLNFIENIGMVTVMYCMTAYHIFWCPSCGSFFGRITQFFSCYELVTRLALANKIRVEAMWGTSNRNLCNHLTVCLIFLFFLHYGWFMLLREFSGPTVKLTWQIHGQPAMDI